MLVAHDAATDTANAVVPVPKVIEGLDGLRSAAGTDLGLSPWVTIDQALVHSFARVP